MNFKGIFPKYYLKTMTVIRKNAKPEWYTYNNSYCLGCGETFQENEKILSGFYCAHCGVKHEKILQLDRKSVNWYEYRAVCVNCAHQFQNGEQILFGKYCSQCGKKWIKERDLRKSRLKKARKM